jgi:hypothetical protein
MRSPNVFSDYWRIIANDMYYSFEYILFVVVGAGDMFICLFDCVSGHPWMCSMCLEHKGWAKGSRGAREVKFDMGISR